MRYNWSKEIIQQAIQESDSYSETLRRLNIPLQGNNTSTLKRKIREYGLDISHFTFSKQYQTGLNNFRYKQAQWYSETGKFIKASMLKLKLIKEGIKENKCEICGLSQWRGKPLTCQLHHINGNNKDNRLENLQMLCPNCHSQTENYCGKAVHKKEFFCEECGQEIARGSKLCIKCNAKKHRKTIRPSKEELLNLYITLKSFSGIGRKYQVSDKTVSKWFKSYNLPFKANELKEYIKIYNL